MQYASTRHGTRPCIRDFSPARLSQQYAGQDVREVAALSPRTQCGSRRLVLYTALRRAGLIVPNTRPRDAANLTWQCRLGRVFRNCITNRCNSGAKGRLGGRAIGGSRIRRELVANQFGTCCCRGEPYPTRRTFGVVVVLAHLWC